MLSVLQASAWYPPASWGGTEVYLAGLVRELRGEDVTSTVVAPFGAQCADSYSFDDVPVRTYVVNEAPTRVELQEDAPHDGLARFREILSEVRPDVYHQHSWTRGLGLPHLRVAREQGLRTVLTVHVAGVTCMRGTMMRYGAQACDGRIDPLICAACWSNERGASKPVALALAALSSKIGSVAERAMPPSRLATALSAFPMIERRRSEVAAMTAYADRIVAVCQWLYDALLLNGVPREKLVLSRQGVGCEFVAAVAEAYSARHAMSINANMRKFSLLYLGRWHFVKGIDVLVRAVRSLPPEAPVELLIRGLGEDLEERAYAAEVKRIAGNDPRIRISAPVSRSALAETLLKADVLAVPSRWLETGPLVVLEAKAAGLPVLGSRLGGIAELVREPDDGLLVPPDDIAAWTKGILDMMARTAPGAPSAPSKVRTMRDVAADMGALYRELCEAPVRSGTVGSASP